MSPRPRLAAFCAPSLLCAPAFSLAAASNGRRGAGLAPRAGCAPAYSLAAASNWPLRSSSRPASAPVIAASLYWLNGWASCLILPYFVSKSCLSFWVLAITSLLALSAAFLRVTGPAFAIGLPTLLTLGVTVRFTWFTWGSTLGTSGVDRLAGGVGIVGTLFTGDATGPVCWSGVSVGSGTSGDPTGSCGCTVPPPMDWGTSGGPTGSCGCTPYWLS